MANARKRNLVVCCDGTWNTPDQKDRDRIAPTNVVKMARAVLTERDGLFAEIEEQGVTIVPQAVFYDTGLGTGENEYGPGQAPESSGWGSKFSSAFGSLKSGGKNSGLKDRLLEAVDKLAGGAGGLGISDKIKDAYRWLCDNYQEDDHIFLFGFSRGAFTVRSLSGLIGLCGLAPAGDEQALEEAWDLYRSRGDKSHREAQRAEADKRGWRRVPIQFLGVWDTVGALGIPKLSEAGVLKKLWDWMTEGSKLDHKFHSVHLSPIVENAAHALALDERRGPFEPSLWRERMAGSEAEDGEKALRNPGPDKIQQVWFAGVHSNIGGGYVDAGLSDHAFMWMAQRAIKAGLYLNPTYLAHRVDPNAHGELRDTLSGLYEKIPQFIRKLDSVDADENPILNEKVHASVGARYRSPTHKYWVPRVRGKTTLGEMEEYFKTGAAHTDEGLSLITRADSAGSTVNRYRAIHGLTSEASGAPPPERVIPDTGLGLPEGLPEADEPQPTGPRQ